ncbi:MAG: DoxX family protein [Xanthobacteraceae bacterium]|nr:DoxX family protein [Xanthobacteraceae bacterium]
MEDFMKPWRAQLLSILRIVSALCILQFGTAKILKFPVVPMFKDVTLTTWPSGYAGILELVLGALLLIGLFTRPAAFILAGEMAFAYFLGHAGRDMFPILNQGTLAIMFCFTFLYLSAAGAGPWSVDAGRGKA